MVPPQGPIQGAVVAHAESGGSRRIDGQAGVHSRRRHRCTRHWTDGDERSGRGFGAVRDRTEQVRDAIVAASGAASCSEVTVLHHLREITSLDLSSQGIASLGANDFDGLVRVKTLDLSGISLTATPAGVFDPLYLLNMLRLDDNQLASLPAGIFYQLWLLGELTLSGNRYSKSALICPNVD